jgi:hypothetical protein
VSAADRDAGVIALGGPKAVGGFLEACRAGRLWERELKVDLDAVALK